MHDGNYATAHHNRRSHRGGRCRAYLGRRAGGPGRRRRRRRRLRARQRPDRLLLEPDGDLRIYSIDPDGENLQRLTGSPGNATWPAWSPDESQIAYLFIGEIPDEDGVYVVSASGRDRRRVSSGGTAASAPAWLSDGREIIYGCASNICVTNNKELETEERILLHDVLSAEASGSVSASPDGRYVVFARDGDLHLAEVDGVEQRQLTTDGALNFKPRWSPDGNLILLPLRSPARAKSTS